MKKLTIKEMCEMYTTEQKVEAFDRMFAELCHMADLYDRLDTVLKETGGDHYDNTRANLGREIEVLNSYLFDQNAGVVGIVETCKGFPDSAINR